jgi:hypothetical protein
MMRESMSGNMTFTARKIENRGCEAVARTVGRVYPLLREGCRATLRVTVWARIMDTGSTVSSSP